MFALGIRYLNGWVMATHPANRTRAEWPPHPDRVFMAMAAAYFETDGPPKERATLEWLERQGPPEICAGDCQDRQTVTSFVPVNDAKIARKGTLDKRIERYGTLKSLDKTKDAGLALLPEFRSRQPRCFPTAIPDDPIVFLCWRDGEPSPQIRAALSGLCAKVTYVGHSASLVQMWVEDHPPDDTRINWVPEERPNGKRLRIPSRGRLAYLESQFNLAAIQEYGQLSAEIERAKGKREKELKEERANKFGDTPPQPRRPTPSLWQAYSPAVSQEVAHAVPSVFDPNIIVLRRVGGRQLGLESTLQVTAALRDTLMSKCDLQPPPEWISGHKPGGGRSEDPHLAFIPLANVGYEHSDGRLLGAAIVVPRTVEARDTRLLSPLIRYDEIDDPARTTLTFGTLGEWALQPEDRDSRPVALQETLWTGWSQGAYRWATVTPIVFDRHPKDRDDAKKKWTETESMIADACERIKLPRPKDVILSPVSMFIGAPHARRYPLMHRKTGGKLHHTHAIITFEQPVLGPVLLGAGRYRGYGLCRPLPRGGEA